MNKYLVIIAVGLAVVLYYAFGRINTLENKNHALQAEKTALEREVRDYNEKTLQASSKIAELRKQIQTHKDDQSDGYRCFDIAIPDDIALFLHNK